MGVRSVLLPDIGEGVAEAEIAEWSVKVGDDVTADQILVAVMTDKANVEIPSPLGGKVLALSGAAGDTIAVGSELIRLETADLPDLPAPARGEAPAKYETPPVTAPLSFQSAAKKAEEPQTGASRAQVRRLDERPLASPAVRRRAREAGIDLHHIAGSGPAGRITHEDLKSYPKPSHARERARTADVSTQDVPVVGLRRLIAQRMAEATRRIAQFSYIEEVDVTALEELRSSLNAKMNASSRPKLTLLPFLMLALAKALPEFPQMNAHYDDDKGVVTHFGGLHLGIATQTPSGLTVPVVRHVETMDLYEAAAEMKRVTEAAREGAGRLTDMSGSTITITSLGPLGGLATTPIINRPEVAIVGVNKIFIKPAWRDNGFVPRKMMNLSSSFDHRVIDGWDAATFIQRLRQLLETPALIFIAP